MADQQSLDVMDADLSEVWEILFAKALMLIGEIEKTR